MSDLREEIRQIINDEGIYETPSDKGIDEIIAKVWKHSEPAIADMLSAARKLGRAKTIERVLAAADIDIEGMSPTKVKYAICQAIKGVGDE